MGLTPSPKILIWSPEKKVFKGPHTGLRYCGRPPRDGLPEGKAGLSDIQEETDREIGTEYHIDWLMKVEGKLVSESESDRRRGIGWSTESRASPFTPTQWHYGETIIKGPRSASALQVRADSQKDEEDSLGEKSVARCPGEVTPSLKDVEEKSFDFSLFGLGPRKRKDKWPFLWPNYDTWESGIPPYKTKSELCQEKILKRLKEEEAEFQHELRCSEAWRFWTNKPKKEAPEKKGVKKEKKEPPTLWVSSRGRLIRYKELGGEHEPELLEGECIKSARCPRAYTKLRLFQKKLKEELKIYKEKYDGTTICQPFSPPQILTSPPRCIPPSLSLPISPSDLPEAWQHIFNGAPAVKGSHLHRIVLLQQFAEAVTFIFRSFGFRASLQQMAKRAAEQTQRIPCTKIKGWIGEQLNWPTSYALDQPDGEGSFWTQADRRLFVRRNKDSFGKDKKYPKSRSVSLCFSLLMAKKYFGDLCVCTVPGFVAGCHERLTTKGDWEATEEAFQALDTAVDELVKPAFFDKYEEYCRGIALPNRAYVNIPRSLGGLHDAIVNEDVTLVNGMSKARQEFVDTLTKEPSGVWAKIVHDHLSGPAPIETRLVGGPLKNRAVTINGPAHFLLKGLQLCLHKGLRQDPRFQFIGKPINAKDLPKVELGSHLVSGDYEAATDNFQSAMTRRIWSKIEEKIGGRVPEHILEIARHSLEPNLMVESGDLQIRGQLMGQLLSFPLLCITNYATWRLRSKPEEALRINGDDILFSKAWKRDVEGWFEDVKKIGLTVSRGKTYVHRRYCTMNSEIFSLTSGGWKRVPFIHLGYLKTKDDPASQLSSFTRDFDRAFATRLAVRYARVHHLYDNELPIFGHPEVGAQGAVLADNLDLKLFYRARNIDRTTFVAQNVEGGNPLRCERHTDHFFREFVKFEKATAFHDVKKMNSERAKLEVARSWAGPYELGEPTRDFSNWGIVKSLLDTAFWEGPSSEASRVFIRAERTPGQTRDEQLAVLEEFARRRVPKKILKVDPALGLA
jgi:hypothetical protein